MAQAVLFDLDGTLVDTIPIIAEAFHATLQELGASPVEEARILGAIGTPLVTMFESLTPAHDPKRASELYTRHYRARVAGNLRVFPDVFPALEHLRERPLAVVTSKGSASAKRMMDETGLARLIPLVVGLDEVQAPKPAPDGILLACGVLGVPPSGAAYVGDSVHDMRAAKRAGARAIGVLTGAATQGELVAAGADHVIPTFSALLDRL